MGSLFTIRPGMKAALCAVLDLVVFRARHYLQVAWVVVCAVAVDMMDGFIGAKWATKHIFRNGAMLGHTSPIAIDNAVSIGVRGVSAAPIPMLRAVLATNAGVLAATYRALAQLLQTGRAKGLIAERSIFLGSHLVRYAQVRSRNLHTAIKAAQLTLDTIAGHFAPHLIMVIPHPNAVIIPLLCV